MSSEDRLKRLGLDHLKDDPEKLKKLLQEKVSSNQKETLISQIEQFRELIEISSELEKPELEKRMKELQKILDNS